MLAALGLPVCAGALSTELLPSHPVLMQEQNLCAYQEPRSGGSGFLVDDESNFRITSALSPLDRGA